MTASKIEWTDRSDWNPIRGCTRVSPGCGGPGPHGGCYAEVLAGRFSDPGQWAHSFATRTPQGGRWTGKVQLMEDRLTLPMRWRRPARIFASSTSDVFHEKLSDADIDKIFAVMALCPHHTFQVLTKRSARMRAYLARPGVQVRIAMEALGMCCAALAANPRSTLGAGIIMSSSDINPGALVNWPLPNVWLGVSVEDQQHADERVPDLLATPAAVRWLSCEPLLGPVDLRNVRIGNEIAVDAMTGYHSASLKAFVGEAVLDTVARLPILPVATGRLDWIVAGGESGPKARPMHPDWIIGLRDQCEAAGVPFFFKQWGEHLPVDVRTITHTGVEFRKVGKKAAGRRLHGIEHNAMPEVGRG